MPSTRISGTPNTSTTDPLAEAFERFLRHGQFVRNWSPKTLRAYRQALSSLRAGVPSAAGGLIPGRAQLEAWVAWLRGRGVTPGACNAYLRAANSFLSWAHAEGLVAEPARLKMLRCETRVVETFSPAHVRALVGFSPRSFAEARLHTLVLALLDTGCRIEELLTARDGSADLQAMMLTVMGKGGKQRRVPFGLELRKALHRWQELKRKRGIPGSSLFCTGSGLRLSYRNAHRDLLAHCTALGIQGPRVSPHTFRHSFASNYLRQGGDIYRLCRILGHSDIRTTMIYLHLSPEDLRQNESLLRAMGK